jgi:hypothetical protein
MDTKYVDWINTNRDKYSQNGCAEMTLDICEEFPSLTRVRGHYICDIWGKWTHWWVIDENGEIIDPTVDQFPSKGLGTYIPNVEGTAEPVGKCINCGEYIFEAKSKSLSFCSKNCEKNTIAHL